jgi:hypothetical protein
MVQATNSLVESHVQVELLMAEVMQRYAIGDLSRDLPDYPGEKGTLTRTLAAVKQSLMAINAQIDELAARAPVISACVAMPLRSSSSSRRWSSTSTA